MTTSSPRFTGVNRACFELVKEFEQFREFAYPDPASPLARATLSRRLRWGFLPANDILQGLPQEIAGLSGAPWTVGYGETRGTKINSRITEEEAAATLRRGLNGFAEQVLDACIVEPNENELAAMTSLAYNIGMGWKGAVKPRGAKNGFRQSTVLDAHNRGDKAAASRAFSLWNKAGGKEMAGLVRRRAAEASLYLRRVAAPVRALIPFSAADEIDESNLAPDMPQSIDAESTPSQSGINRASIAAGGTTALAAVAEGARTAADIKFSVDSLGEWILPLLLVVVVGLCIYIYMTRQKQRKDGWA